MGIDKLVQRAAYITSWFIAGAWIFGALPLCQETAIVPAAAVAFIFGAIMLAFGPSLAKLEAYLLTLFEGKVPDPTRFDILTIQVFGLLLATVSIVVVGLIR